MNSKAKRPPNTDALVDDLAKLLHRFATAKTEHSENPEVPPHGLQIYYWILCRRKCRLIAKCSSCGYKMGIDPNSANLKHLDPRDAMGEMLFWEDEVVRLFGKQ